MPHDDTPEVAYVATWQFRGGKLEYVGPSLRPGEAVMPNAGVRILGEDGTFLGMVKWCRQGLILVDAQGVETFLDPGLPQD